MEIGKLYISDDKKVIVECNLHNEYGSFGGVVVKSSDPLCPVGCYKKDWITMTFKEYTQPATSVQIGGNHYKDCKIQPTEFIHANNIPFIEGNIIKYVIRHKSKNGIEDLKKARHYIDLLINFEYESKESL